MSNELEKAIKRFTRISCEILDHAETQIKAINAGLGMIADAEEQARAEMRARRVHQLPRLPVRFSSFPKGHPQRRSRGNPSRHRKRYGRTCPTCIAEYTEYLNSIKCEHGIENWENCSECLDAWAEANAPEDVVLDNPSDWEVQNGI